MPEATRAPAAPLERTLLDKIWDLHAVRELPSGQTQLFIGLHLVHEVTSPQGFEMLRAAGRSMLFPERTFATVDHIVPTDTRARPLADAQAEEMLAALEENTAEHRIAFYGWRAAEQGIVHVIGPELGLTQPGMTIACGDSHTSTHGAFGALAFGIGTTQVRDVLASQCLAMLRPRVRRIDVTGELGPGVSAKDVILHIIRTLGVKGGIGFAYEYGGAVVERFSMEERMTLCNMSIEGGARVGYVNPDATTFAYLRGRPQAPAGEAFERAQRWWSSLASEPAAAYDDRVAFDGSRIAPTVTWGTHPGQAIGVDERLPALHELPDADRATAAAAYAYMDLRPGEPIAGTPIDVAFVGSCTNSRISDLRAAARVLVGKHIAPGLRALAVPGSRQVREQAEREGLDEIFRAAGFEWREPGCSMCLAMNPDRLHGRELCASSSNRNYAGRQGSPQGRTLLMSPAMVAAAALRGRVTDLRELL